MSIERLDSGPRLSRAVIHGNTIYLAGQVAPDTSDQSVAGQTAQILSGIDALLARAGTSKHKLLSVTVWMTDLSRFAEMNKVWEAWIEPGCAPARATAEVKLATPGYLVEMTAIAALGD